MRTRAQPHREPALHGRHGDLGPHRYDRDLPAIAFHELERTFEAVLVAGVERAVGTLAHEQVVGSERRCALRLCTHFTSTATFTQ